jgi:flagellar hook protein FlgE
MIDALYNGISGLNTFQSALNSESNNVTNTNTVAYKADKITFADLMYQNGYGMGAQVSGTFKDFSQGNITITTNPLDVAIVGDGFFTVQDMYGETQYTRGGNFASSKDGFLKTQDDRFVMGVSIDAPSTVGTLDPSTGEQKFTIFSNLHTENLASQEISNYNALQSINARATNYNVSATDTGESGNNLKSKGANIRDVDELKSAYQEALVTYSYDLTEGSGTASEVQITNATFDPNDFSENGDELSIFIDSVEYKQSFDTDAETTLKNFVDKLSNITAINAYISDEDTGEIVISSMIPGREIEIRGASINDIGVPSTTIQDASVGNGLAAYISVRDALQDAVENANADFIEMTTNIDLDKESSLDLGSLQLRPDRLDISDDPFGSIEIKNGAIYKTQGENSFLIGKIVTSVFNDNLKLEPIGDNLYVETEGSGEPLFSRYANSIKGSAIEVSNSDLGKSLTNLMVYQRGFQANSSAVTTSDEFLKTAIQLKS